MASIQWSSTQTTQLLAYTERLKEAATQVAADAVEYLHGRTVARAQNTPEWQPLADTIEVWSQDGQLVIGVQDETFVSEAFALEYGDEVTPPSPLFRTMGADVQDASDLMTKEMESLYGYGGRFRAPAQP